VRDVDWAKHASNTPHTVENFTRALCPFGGGYDGPCGRQGHCESHVISEAVWDLANRDLPDPGSADAWAITERLWYVSRPTATSAFVCHNATTPWTSDGCATGSLFRTLRAADDDDGNLANGTPHSCHIFAALNRHGLACAGDAGANVCFSGCTPPAAPTLGLTAGNRQVDLNWSGSGPGAMFDVFRSESGCDAGFLRLAAGLTGSSYVDNAVANGLTYSYRIVAHGTGNVACAAPPTACQSATPQEPPCNTPPPAPTGLTATASGVDQISLSWGTVAGAVEYRVYRSASAGGPFTQLAAVAAPTTTYIDSGLAPGTTRYYLVRSATGDACASADSNVASATTTQCQAETLYQNGFEGDSGLAGWTLASLGGPGTSWRGVQTCAAHGGSKIFRFGGETCNGFYTDNDHAAVRPQADTGFVIPPGAALNRLAFWHRRDFEYGYDGGTLKLSLDGGPWVQVPGSALSGEAYDTNLYYPACAPAGTDNTPVFTGWKPDFGQTVVNLDAACAAAGSPLGCGGHTIRLQFETITDCSVVNPGWFLDDVSVTTCVPRGCTGAPVIGTASTPASHQVQVSWSNGTPASNSFNVYRALGTCAAPGPFTRIASGVSGSPYLDSPVSGGVTWAYRVAGLDATGICESDLSGCVQASPSGACTLAPTFAGAAEVDDQVGSTCALSISWVPATAHCGGPATYDVFRSTSPGFVPSPANRIATGVTGTSYQDLGTLQYGTTYYYVVRAVDSTTGQSDANTVRLSGTPTGLLHLPVTVADTFEAADGFDLDDWTHAVLSGSKDWEHSTVVAQGGTHSWHAGGDGFTAHRVLVSPAVQAGPDTVLSFWHTYRFESCFDGGVLEISVDGGGWSYLPGSAFLAGGYNSTIFTSGNPLGGLKGWCEGTIGPMTQVRVDLSAWAGHEVRVRWHMGEDSSVAYDGWYVDTVAFQEALVENGCQASPPPPVDFYTVAPCRLVDTRAATGPAGGPALQPGQTRTFLLAGSCGIPAAAKALSVNMTVVSPTAGGNLSLFPADQAAPIASSINFQAGQNRANNALISLSAGGAIQVQSNTGGPVHFLLDVNGWFQE
jgi:fibronectin type 3 domain-containing protein